MNPGFKKPLPRSKTPEPKSNREDAAASRACPATVRVDSRNLFPGRGAKSENDLRKTTKPKEILNKQDRLKLAYNAYLQSVLTSIHHDEMRERQEKEVLEVMENQQLELRALDEEKNYFDMVLMKIQLFKEMKEKMERKTELCQLIVDTINELELDSQIKTVENSITKLWLKNFKLSETDEDKKAVLDFFKKIDELLNVIPEIKKIVEPLNDVHASLVKAQELDDAVEKSKKECLKKLKQAETMLYDKLYLETTMNKCENGNS